ncbi:MAG: 50S ribosomal protein L32 [Rickettsiales bacterium]|nr:50S ribosomal protein L32 [Rickettsiales bacterium]
MAVPKQKISKSRRGMRTGSNGSLKADFPNVVTDKTTGEFKLPHHISVDGYYKGKKVIAEKTKKEKKDA